MKKLRIAVVGCGGMARFYCKRYTQIEGAELALVIDSNLSAAEKIADSLGCAFSDRFEDALAPDIDVVDISTPNFLHEFQALSAIDSDKHVILQKPLAPSIAEGEHILAASKRTKRNVGMYMSMFNNPVMYDMKRLIAEGYLGEIEGVHCRNAHRGGLITHPGTWRGDLAKCGGGSFIQLAIHSIDAVQWLIG
ncbi:MAG: Gfo/Idh/MocA family oxidoreductase, partial [Clostridia bacterium]|nr:Gfo/Idh/MocA family oxidoreductase [Clostridia bacterium]